MGAGTAYPESLRSLIRAISLHEKDILAACDSNQYNLSFLSSQLIGVDQAADLELQTAVVEGDDMGTEELEEEPVSEVVEVIEPKKKRKAAIKKLKTVRSATAEEEEGEADQNNYGDIAFELDRTGSNQPAEEVEVRKAKKRKAKI